VLASGEPSPFPPESDEEKGQPAGDEPEKAKESSASGGQEAETKKTPPATRVDFEGIERRVVPVPGLEPRHWQVLAPGKAGELLLLEAPELTGADDEELGAGALSRYSIEKREAEKLADQVAELHVAPGGEKMLFRSGETWTIAGTDGPVEKGKGALDLDAMAARIDPPAEWRQIYREAWRLQRDFFYDPAFHGLDLAAAEARYQRYLPGLAHRDDLNYLLVEMLGELSVGHLYVAGGDTPEAERVAGGLLGADWSVENGRYRIARLYSGESWNPELAAPLDRPEVGARVGDYLIAVEGRELAPPESLYAPFEGTAGKRVRIRLAADPGGQGARDVTVVPIANERQLRYRAWVEGNRREVERLSGGKLGYVHLPNTAGAGFESFNRYFFAQIDRPAMLLDERYNGGGLVADYVVEILAREPMWGVAARTGADMLSPAGAHYGPKAMLINRHAGSGGDALPWMFRHLGLGPLVGTRTSLPWMFRHLGLGPLVGTRTWGGLVGIWDFPELVDGGLVTAPRGGLYTIHGQWEIENQGVEPDFEVEVTPKDFAAGRDPQLEQGVALLLEALETGAPKRPARPPFPDYQASPWRSEARP